MVPTIWRYLLRSYFQVFILSVSAFIGVLLVLRFQEIARFIASGAAPMKVLLFAALQIPYILPIAIPISCLISAILLFQKLSDTQELTALRAAGWGIKEVALPIAFAAIFLTLINFVIADEVAPRSRGRSKALVYEMAMNNPLFLLQKESLIKLKSAYGEAKTLKAGKSAQEVLLAIRNASNGHLAIVIAKELAIIPNKISKNQGIENSLLKGSQVTIISSGSAKNDDFDHLVIENQAEMNTQASHLSQFMQTADWKTSYDYMPLRQIFTQEHFKKKPIFLSKDAIIELSRRFSIAFAAFTFTVIGVTFGIHVERNRSKKGVVFAITLSCLFLFSFISAKSLKHAPPLVPSMIFFLPHPLILFLSLRSMKAVEEGVS